MSEAASPEPAAPERPAPLPDLGGDLEALLDKPLPDVPWSGPRRWWNGPLDVEGLALASVRLAVGATRLLDVPGPAAGPGGVPAGTPAIGSRDVPAGTRSALATASDLVAGSFASLTHLRIDGRTPEGFAPLSGFRPTADGWIRLHANYPHHAAALHRALEVDQPDQIEPALRELGALEAEQRIRSAGGVAAAVRTVEQWRAHPAGRAVTEQPLIRIGLPDRPPAPTRWPIGSVAGLRVLDLTRVIAGPTASAFLAALGADVLRVDPPHLPELTDQHLDRDAAKRSALADLHDATTLDAVHDLLATADVLLLGYRPGALDRFGLCAEVLGEWYPQLVVVALNAWGDSGPWGNARGFDSIVQAATGIGHLYGTAYSFGTAHINGSTDAGSWRPGALPVQALDHATGYLAAAAALALIVHRDRTRTAGTAHLSLARTAQSLLDLPRPTPADPVELPATTTTQDTVHGRLTAVVPPVTADGHAMDVPPPGPYGADPLGWRGVRVVGDLGHRRDPPHRQRQAGETEQRVAEQPATAPPVRRGR